MAVINQTPADWWNLVQPINDLGEALEKTRHDLGILTNYVEELEKRVKVLESRDQLRKNVSKARKYKGEHWVVKAKKDFWHLKHQRKEQGKPTNTDLKGAQLYKMVTEYSKAVTPREKSTLEEKIFGN